MLSSIEKNILPYIVYSNGEISTHTVETFMLYKGQIKLVSDQKTYSSHMKIFTTHLVIPSMISFGKDMIIIWH